MFSKEEDLDADDFIIGSDEPMYKQRSKKKPESENKVMYFEI